MAFNLTRLVKPEKKLRNLLRKMDSNPAPEQVHDFRTNARRFEAAFRALALDDANVPKSVFKALGHLRKRAGKVRDLDVLTEFAAGVHPNEDTECHVRLLEHLGARRQQKAAKLHAEMKQLRGKLRKALDNAASRITRLLREKDSGAMHSAITNAAATAMRLSAELATPARLNKTSLHPYRLKVKELRNILLMAEAPSLPRFVEDLGAVKDAIGEWHDWEELVEVASKLRDHDGECLLRSELKRIAERKYDYGLALALKLRNSYLKSSQPQRNKAPLSGVFRPPVLEAIARLAG